MPLSSANSPAQVTPEVPFGQGRGSRPPMTVHLVGVGKVGQAFLGWLAGTPLRLIGATDSTATCHDRKGLCSRDIARFKADGGSLVRRSLAEALSVNLAVELVNADVVVDATPTRPGQEGEAIERGHAVLRRGGRLVLAAKDALCRASREWLNGEARGRVGCNAVLGGTGLSLTKELGELGRRCKEVVLVPNASTTAILEAVESGAAIEAGIRDAQSRGLLEADPTLDLDGSDAAVKLAIVAGALWKKPVPLDRVQRQDIRDLDTEKVCRLWRDGWATRLVARAKRGGELRVGYETLPRTSPLCTPSNRVAYGYVLDNGQLRVHIGGGLGPVETARCLLEDVLELTCVEPVT